MPAGRGRRVPLWATLLATAALVLVAAKAHGRQVRLEREQKGVFHVDFRRGNPAVAEGIWRRDRRTFWASFAGLALAGGAFAAAGRPEGLLPALGFAAAFVVAGLASWVRLTVRKEGPLPWRRRAQAGSALWWSAVAAAALLVALSA
jgi:hypothetical protein